MRIVIFLTVGIVFSIEDPDVKLWLNTLLRFVTGTYFVLTSLYCLLAFLPYTFYFLIKAPAYAWVPWFVHYHAALYWAAVAAAALANRQSGRWWRHKDRGFVALFFALVAGGVYLTFRPFLPGLADNRAAYWWSLVSLLPLLAMSLSRAANGSHAESSPDGHEVDAKPFGYSGGLLIALVVSAIYTAGARIRIYGETGSLSFHFRDAEFAVWSLVSHFILVIVVLSLLNLIYLLAAKTTRPRLVRRGMTGALIFAALWAVLARFLGGALSFGGGAADVYAASLALTLTLWGFALVLPVAARLRNAGRSFIQLATWITLVVSSVLAVAFPYLIGGTDWSGFLQSTVTLAFWTIASICLFRLRRTKVQYSVGLVLMVLIGSGLFYRALQISEIFWSRPLGSTDDEISLALEAYAGHDNSFQLAHHILGNSRNEICGDLCRIMREYTNVRDTRVRTDIPLVDDLKSSRCQRPNIFVFVIDAMRPDYLGAYNPRVDYTPNLDAFARDSIVMHNAYSQYAGTSLSEPALWAGAMMLHAHYLQPFSSVNGLEKMLRADHYHMLVSMDEVIKELLSPTDNLVKLDTDKKLWNQLEIGSTLRQAESVLDTHASSQGPIFFYAQPKNVHQFARNDVPGPASQHWPDRAGLNTRITYEVHWVDSRLGEFFNYLKQRGMYDDSIIIVTSDHGDATGEFGRVSHSTSIWPEIMHVPLIIHLPPKMRGHLVYDDTRLSTLTDITPTLYYLLGHRPLRQNPLYGRPLFAETRQELDRYQPKDLLLASDVRAVYGILTADGQYLYTVYDSPAQSYLFDLAADPNAEHNILTAPLKQRYDEEIIEHLQLIGDFYGYKPGVGSLLASSEP